MSNALKVPQEIIEDDAAQELARIWMSSTGQQIVLRPEAWEDPAAWGILLVDIASHVALAIAKQRGVDNTQVLLRIREGFDAEWSNPTDHPAGGIV